MTIDKLPQTKKKKMINIHEFVKLAEKVKSGIQEEIEYLNEKSKHGHNNSTKFYKLS